MIPRSIQCLLNLFMRLFILTLSLSITPNLNILSQKIQLTTALMFFKGPSEICCQREMLLQPLYNNKRKSCTGTKKKCCLRGVFVIGGAVAAGVHCNCCNLFHILRLSYHLLGSYLQSLFFPHQPRQELRGSREGSESENALKNVLNSATIK